MHEQPDNLNDVAIIGMQARVPGAENVQTLWRNVRDGVESITRLTDDELERAGVPEAARQLDSFVNVGARLPNIDRFDAAFFGFSPTEATVTDPQFRLMLECAWSALEDAGYDPQRYGGSIGVCAGVGMNTYLHKHVSTDRDLLQKAGSFQVNVSNAVDSLATLVSYKLDLKGPSFTVQTACSSSLVAVHLCCQSLLSGECDMSLAGGVTINPGQDFGYWYQDGGILSEDGHCRSFDARANGTIFGSGVAMVVLKRMADALADGDAIYAVIKGSAVNNDGSAKAGYTAPGVLGHAKVVAEAMVVAQVEPDSIDCIEAHGTATILGDPIEIEALTRAYRERTSRRGFCAIGSIKTNMGHLDRAAGVVGLIKMALALKHRQIPPSLHFERPNPKIDFDSSPFFVNTALRDWEPNGTPRRAGVSSLGIGGTNAHVILEETPAVERSSELASPEVLMLSARSDAALEVVTDNLASYLDEHPDTPLADIAHTLQVGRRRFASRRIVVAHDIKDAAQSLRSRDRQRLHSAQSVQKRAECAFLFPGQGTQYVRMAHGLIAAYPFFKETVDLCNSILRDSLRCDLLDILYPKPDEEDAAAEKLRATSITQPALFTIEYALARLWMSWGITPAAMLGHSIGEYVAACLAGVMTLEDALALVAHRAALMQAQPPGSMLAIPLPESEIESLLTEGTSLAAVNGPRSCVVSGDDAALEVVKDRLEKRDIEGLSLRTSHAFHSALMEPMVQPFVERVAKIALSPPRIPYISNLTGTWITNEQATDPNYYGQHLRNTVRFSDGIATLRQGDRRVWLEVGPGRSLASMARQQVDPEDKQTILSSTRRPTETTTDVDALLTTLGQLWMAGAHVDWDAYRSGNRPRRVSLPTYPFERQRYWVDPKKSDRPTTARKKSGKKKNVADWFHRPSWKQAAPLALDSNRTPEGGAWLIFQDACGIGPALRGDDGPVFLVEPGDRFEKLADRRYAINPTTPGDYDKLLQAISESTSSLGRIVHLWGTTPDRPDTTQTCESILNRTFYSLLNLSASLARDDFTEPLRLTVVTNHTCGVIGDETFSPEKSTVVGPCKVIPHEFPNLTCSHIDAAFPDGEPAMRCLLEQIRAEIHSAAPEPTVALRGMHRWVPIVEPVAPTEVEGDRPAILRDRGVYLITGGLGGIGLTLAEHLARKVQACLVLVGRSPFPERTEWDAWLKSHPTDDRTSSKIEKIRNIEKLGAEVLSCSADIADVDALRDVVRLASERFGVINGIIHAAGVPGGGLIELKTREAAAAVLSPKVHGTRALELACEGMDLDFVVLCSSITSLIGGVGQVDYCAANAFLDTFAQQQWASRARRCLSINWDAWQEVGMAVDTDVPAFMRAKRQQELTNAITPEEGCNAFDLALSSPHPQLIIYAQDWEALLQQSHTTQRDAIEKPTTPTARHERPTLSTAYVAPETDTECKLANLWQEMLGIEKVGLHDNFFELGGHSLLAVQLIRKAKETFTADISVASLFEGPTVQSLARLIEPSGDEPTGLQQSGDRGKRRKAKRTINKGESSHA